MADQERDEARALADRLSSVELRYTLKAGKLGQLYGSVSQADIVASLTEKGFEIDRRKVLLKESIKRVGGQNVEIRLLGDIHAKIRVIVEAEEVEGEAEVAAENEEQVIAQSSEPDAEASEEEMVDDGDSEDDESEKNADA
jgi:large subunit ribosomal protein L9